MNHAGNSSYRDDDEELFYLLNGMDGKRRNEHNNGQDHHSAPSDHHAEAASGKNFQSFDDSDIEMFVDVNGLPTDTFLESLKRDPVGASEKLTSKLGKDFHERSPSDFTARKVQYQSRYLDSSSDSDSDRDVYDRAAPHRSRDTFFQYLQDTNQQRTSEKQHSPQSSPPRSQPKKKKQVVTTAAKKVVKKKKPATREAPGHSTPIPISSTVKGRDKKQPVRHSNRLCCSLDSGVHNRQVSPTRKSTNNLRVSHSSDCKNSMVTFDIQQTEEKNKSLQLRVNGQLNSIRVLETQLAEANHTIAVRDLELASALKRVAQLESRAKDSNVRKEHDDDIVRRANQKDDGKMFQIKTELMAVQARFNDEKSKRARTEERLRIIKEFCEKQKVRVSEVEEKNAELESVLKQLHAKLQKKKQEIKSTSKDVTVNRVKVVEKDSQLQTCKNQLLRSDRTVKDLRLDNDRLKEELRLLRREASSAEDKNRRSQLELEVLRERQTATKLAYRLQSQNQSFAQSPSNLFSKHSDASLYDDRRTTSGSSSNQSITTPTESAKVCPYSKSRSRSRSNSRRNRGNNIRDSDNGSFNDENDNYNSNNVGRHEKSGGLTNYDTDEDTASIDESVDSYDVDQLLIHHRNESVNLQNKISSNAPPSPPRNDEQHGSGSCDSGNILQDVSLLSDSTGMGEEFDRLQKMYKRVQGKNHT